MSDNCITFNHQGGLGVFTSNVIYLSLNKKCAIASAAGDPLEYAHT